MMAKRNRILMILENESFPDDTRVLFEARSLVAAGFCVSVICPTGDSTLKFEMVEGVRVLRYPKPWEINGFVGYVAEFAYSMLMAFLYSWFVFFRYGFDAIHVHTPPDMNAFVAIPFRIIGKKYVVDMHDLSPELYQAQRGEKGSKLVESVLRWFERVSCRWADRLISTNETQQQVQISRSGVEKNRCVVVRNGPNEMFQQDVAPHSSLSDRTEYKLGYVGMVGVQDGVDYFVNLIDVISKKRDDVIGVIVGKGPALDSLKTLVAELNLESKVIFTGFVNFDDVPAYISAFDVCVTPDPLNPYNDSCTTIKTMEYMALGKPTIAFDTSENKITAQDSALYAENNDVDFLAEMAIKLLDDPELRAKLGRRGRERIKNQLSWDHQQQNLVGLYRELLHSKSEKTSKVIENSTAPIHNRLAK